MKKFLPIFIMLLLMPLVSAQSKLNTTLSPIFDHFNTVFIVIVLVYIVYRVYKMAKLYRKEGFVLSTFFSQKKNFIPVILVLVGVILFVLAMFQPWYTVSADINLGQLNTNGLKDVVSIDGINGIVLGDGILPGVDLPQRSLTFILALLLVSSIFIFIGSKSLKSFGWGGIRSGAIIIVVIVLIFGLIMFLPSVLNSMLSKSVAGSPIGDLITGFTSAVSSSPMAGQYSYQITENIGSFFVKWTFGIGFYLFLISAILKIIGGALAIKFYKKPKK